MRLSILIASWNTRLLLEECLRSLFAYPLGEPTEIIVVDNASSDGSAGMVAAAFPTVCVIRNSHNLGYAAANNQAVRCATGAFILLLGSDTLVHEGTLRGLVDFFDLHPDAGAVGARLVLPDGKLQRSCHRFPTLLNALATYSSLHWLNRRYHMYEFDHSSVREVDQPDATCLMIRRGVIEQIGLFDERYRILYNDVDLCQRIVKAGWKIFFTPAAVVTHYGSRSTRQADPNLRVEMYRDILLYYHREKGLLGRQVLLPFLFLRLLIVTRSMSAFQLFSSSAAKGLA